jgi:hypothetical protein
MGGSGISKSEVSRLVETVLHATLQRCRVHWMRSSRGTIRWRDPHNRQICRGQAAERTDPGSRERDNAEDRTSVDASSMWPLITPCST